MWSVIARLAVLALVVACGDPAARVELAPINACGPTLSKTALRVIAYTAGGEQRRSVPPNEIDAFPADTEQLGVEVIGQAGALIAIGKTAPLELAGLDDGTTIPILMAPPDGFCPVGPMTEPRVAPLVARAGPGVLVAGGLDATGRPLSTAEYYDPATATFTPVDVPASLVDPDNGLAGAVLTELPDGRAALTGTANHAFALFSATTRELATPSLFDHRAFHGAIAPDPDHLFVLGGCSDVIAGACGGGPVETSFSYSIASPTQRMPGPQLPSGANRDGGRIYDLGIQRDGVRRFMLAGGFGDPGVADRFALTDQATEPIGGVHAQVTPLDGGTLLTAFEPDGTAQTGAAGMIVPDGGVVSIGVGAPKLDGVRLATLEDGSVIAIGPTTTQYLPTTNAWLPLPPVQCPQSASGCSPPSIFAPVTARLGDGTLLVLGGRDSSAQAWIYRPALVGPRSGSITALPDGSTGGVLVAVDPSRLDRSGARFTLVGDDDYRARALVGGPRVSDGSISAVVRVQSGGIALIAQQTGPGRAIVGRLVPGEPARIQQLDGGTTKTLCSGSMVDAGEITAAVGLAITGGEVTLSVGAPGTATVKATCASPTSERGAWGVAAAGAGGRIDIASVIVARTR